MWNCGINVPQVIGSAAAVVQSQVNLKANPLTGLIAGSVYGNDQISCGGTQSTQWLVTEYIAGVRRRGLTTRLIKSLLYRGFLRSNSEATVSFPWAGIDFWLHGLDC